MMYTRMSMDTPTSTTDSQMFGFPEVAEYEEDSDTGYSGEPWTPAGMMPVDEQWCGTAAASYESYEMAWYDDSYHRLRRASEIIGASTVAIDNKIEQAMDLVKSHLMFAVREEVEVLKEQIKELLDKNSQLEYENSVLKAAATPETLASLQQTSAPQQQPQPPTSSS